MYGGRNEPSVMSGLSVSKRQLPGAGQIGTGRGGVGTARGG